MQCLAVRRLVTSGLTKVFTRELVSNYSDKNIEYNMFQAKRYLPGKLIPLSVIFI